MKNVYSGRKSSIIKMAIVVFILNISPAIAADYYVNCNASNDSGNGQTLGNAKKYIQSGMAVMSTGDTLWLADCTYSNSSDFITNSSYPPNGISKSQPTTIRAINEGGVTIDGGTSGRVISWTTGNHQYIKFHGIKFTHNRSAQDLINVGAGVASYIWFYRCGFYRTNGGGSSTVWIAADYFLFEECYFWGSGRYGLNLRTPGKYHIVRRSVARLDDADAGGLVIGGFMSYEADYVEYQNSIILDTDVDDYKNVTYAYVGFLTHKIADGNGTHYNYFRGCMVLNVDAHLTGSTGPGFGYLADGATTTNILIDNSLAWDVKGYGVGVGGGENVTINSCTLGNLREPGGPYGYGIRGNSGTNAVNTNNITYNASRYGIRGSSGLDYNNVYGNDSADYNTTTLGSNDVSKDPLTSGLKYLTRIENGSDLADDGSGGGPIGATIMMKYGTDGTFYGDAGYNTLTSEKLWPFPNEDQIRAGFQTYNPGGTDTAKSDGKRGFAADSQSLTNYIWGHLGNTVPPMNVQASPGNTKITLTWDSPAALTNITSFKIYDVTGVSNPVVPGAGTLKDTVSGNSTFTATVSSLTNGTSYTFAVTAIDSGSGESSYSYLVSATPVPFSITSPSDGTIVNASGSGTDSGKINCDAFTVSGVTDSAEQVTVTVGGVSMGTSTSATNWSVAGNICNTATYSEGSSVAVIATGLTSSSTNSITIKLNRIVPAAPSVTKK